MWWKTAVGVYTGTAMFAAAPLVAQSTDPAEAVAVAAAAAAAVRAGLPTGTVAVVPEQGKEAAAQEVARALEARVASLADVRPCGRLPSSCRLHDAIAALQVHSPVLAGDSATVVVMAWWVQDSARQPVPAKAVRVTLARSGNQWVVVKQDLVFIS